MPNFRSVNAKRVIVILGRLGFRRHDKKAGSHMTYKHIDGRRTTVPVHSRDVPIGTLLAILKDIKISRENFLKLL